jgi:hypothetical protein
MVVPNAIPRRLAELPPAYEREPDVVTIGWTGTVGTHPYDLQEMGSGLQQALDRTRGRSRFAIMGQGEDARERLRLAEDPVQIPWSRTSTPTPQRSASGLTSASHPCGSTCSTTARAG